MKKISILFALYFASNAIYSQELNSDSLERSTEKRNLNLIESLENQYTQIANYEDNRAYYIKKIPSDSLEATTVEDIINIINLNVLGYFQLTEKYNTNLKVLNYKKTEEYFSNLKLLKEIKKDLLSRTFFHIEDKSRIQISDYNLREKKFHYIKTPHRSNDEIYEYEGLNVNSESSRFIEDYELLIDKQPLVIQYYNRFHPYESFKITDLKTAEKIESNKSNIIFIYLFKIKGTGNECTSCPPEFLIIDLKKVMIVDSITQDILFSLEYKPMQKQPSKQKK